MQTLLDEIPVQISELIEKDYGGKEKLQIAIKSDIDAAGQFNSRWLIMNDTELIITSNEKTVLATRFDISKITGAKTESAIGVGILYVEIDGNPTDVIHFTNSLMGKFNKAAKLIDSIAKNEEASDHTHVEERQRCPTCGLLMDNWTKVCPKCINKKKIMARLFSYVGPYKWTAVSASILYLLTTLIDLIPPYLTKPLLDDVLIPAIKEGDIAGKTHKLAVIVLIGVTARLVSTILTIFRGRTAGFLGNRITYDIRNQLYESLQRLSMSYFDKRQVGAVLTHVTQDSNQLSGFLVEGVQYYAVNVIQIIGIATILFSMNWKLALLIILPSPFLVLLTYVSWKILMKTWRNFWHSWMRLGAVLSDGLSGIKVVKSFGQEKTEIEKFGDPSEQVYIAGLRAEQIGAIIWPTMGIVMMSGILLVNWFGGLQVIHGNTSTGTLMLFMAYSGMFYAPLQMLTQISNWMSRSFSAADRIFEVIDTVPDIRDADDAVPMPYIKGDIEFKNVTFGYDKYKPVLTDVSFDVKAGEMIGLVGRSGSGKTTTINLVSRLYDASDGQILVDGVDIKNIKVEDLRRQIGVVLQDPYLFAGTVADNIAYGRPEATREEVMAAAKAANAHEFIMRFPDGYDTPVRERGQRLSGGERQRISIARAILRNPRILIFDEATSSVDTETEKKLQEAITRLVQGRTTFAIAHRLSTLRNADRLLVIEHGKFVEFGTHEELLKKKGVYHKLVQLQKEVSRLVAVDG
ncbi:MAG: ABC transporter ATP-binding protein [Armatimonadota bacterium]